MTSGRRPAWLLAAAVFAIAVAVTTVRFQYWLPQVWFGDDLRDYFVSVDGLYASGPGASLVTTFAGKWRPVFTFLLWLQHTLFGTELGWYQAVAVALQAATGTALFLVARRVAGSTVIALALAIVLVWSRFAMYQVTQVNGMLEELPLILVLCALLLVLAERDRIRRLEDYGRWHPALHLAMLLLALAAHTHERYLGAVFAVAVALLFLGGVALRERLLLAAEAAAIVVFNVVMKVWVLAIPFFIGAGGRPMDADLLRTLDQVGQALLSILWFNSGPLYLAGATTVGLGPPWIVLAALLCLAAALLLALGVRRALREEAWPALLFLLCGACLAAPAVASFRLEHRWILASFAMFLLLLAWAARGVRVREVAAGLTVAILCGSLVLDNRLSLAGERQFYLTSSMRLAEAARPLADGGTEPIVFEGMGRELCSWILTEGQFFRMYQGRVRPLYCIGPSWAYPEAPPGSGTVRYGYDRAGFARLEP